MTAPRSRKEYITYEKHRKRVEPNVCEFCQISKGDDQFVEQFQFFKVIKNIFPYSIWDGQNVADHLMVVPLKHTDNLSNMSVKEKVEYVDILQKYESRGYNIYARAPVSIRKSIIHQHTHLIKPIGSVKHFILALTKPFFRIVR